MVADARFNPALKTVLDDLLLGHPLVREGKMFGFPAYYAGRKLSICLYEQGVGLKLPEEAASELLESDPNVVPFQPMGKRKMREWIQIDLESPEDYRRYSDVFERSIDYVLSTQQG
jgi:hypothetical protein